MADDGCGVADGQCIYDVKQTYSPSHSRYYDWYAGAQIMQLKCVEEGVEVGYTPGTFRFAIFCRLVQIIPVDAPKYDYDGNIECRMKF